MGTIELILILIAAVAISTLLYRLVPYRKLEEPKPRFSIFPKYVTTYSCSLDELKSSLSELEFTENENGSYSRGKVYGDFSAKAIKLSVQL